MEKPLSTIEFDIAIKTVIIPKIPNSTGESILARTIPTKKVIHELAILSAKLQLTPFIALFFNESIVIY